MKRLGRGILLVALALAGCARFEPRPLAPATSAARLESRSLTNEPVRVFLQKHSSRDLTPWPPPTWDFELLTLAALYYQPALEVARAQWAVARGAERTAAQRPNPTLTVTPGYNSTTLTPSPWIPLGFLDVPLETAGKRRHRRAEAASLAESARFSVSTVAWQVRSQLRTSLVDLDVSERREKIVEQQLALQEEIVQLLEQQAQAGALAPSELLTVRIALIRLRSDLTEAQRLREEARTRVAEAIGVPLRALDELELNFLSLREGVGVRELTEPKLRRAALLSRPDILAALEDYGAAQADLQLQIAKQYPDVHLQPGYQYDQGDNKWSLGLVVELPVLHQNQGPITEAKARRQEAAAKFEALQAKVLAEIERAAQALNAAVQSTKTLRGLAAAQAQRRDSIAAQFKAGAVERVDLLNAQAEYATAELAQLDAESKFQQAIGAMEEAVQRPLDLPATAVEFNPTDAH